MNRTQIKPILFAIITCFFMVNASAQKTSKMTTEVAKKKQAMQSANESAEENFKYEYAVVTLEGKPGAYQMNMKSNEAKESKHTDPMLLKAQYKMNESGNMKTETEILGFLTDLGYELVTVIPLTGEREMGVKYYLRKKVQIK